MKRNWLKPAGTLMCLLLVGMLSATDASAYWWGGKAQRNGCQATARTMRNACHFDAADNYKTSRAICINIGDRDERMACYREAATAVTEEFELCGDVREARRDACEMLDEEIYDPDPLLDPTISFISPDDIPALYPANPYFQLTAGHTYVLRAGEGFEETVVVTVTPDSRDIQGVACRVVVDAVVIEDDLGGGVYEYEPVEITDDLYAQDVAANVYYCGELSRNFEDGVLRDLDGSFESGIDRAKAGILIKALPEEGEAHRQEYALGEAEDIVEYVSLAATPGEDEGGDNAAFPCAPDLCLKTHDTAPIEPASTEFKYYFAGTGFVLGVGLEDGEVTGERDELLCVGDSLDVLSDPACGIGDVDALLEELCKLSPDAFCPD